MNRRLIIAMLLVAVAMPASADFKAVERSLRTQLGRPMMIPFIGLARFATWIVSPHGVHDFQLAVWEDSRKEIDLTAADLEETLRSGLSPDFQPVVRVRENHRRGGEWTFIYVRAQGERFELLLLTHDHSDTVLVRAEVDAAELSRTINDPNSSWGRRGNHRRERRVSWNRDDSGTRTRK